MHTYPVAAVVLGFALAGAAHAQETAPYDSARPFGTLRQQAAVQQAWVKERLDVNLAKVMRDHAVDMWVVSMREYNEDPVFRALVSPTAFAARRRTIYVFYDRGPAEGVERLALGGGSMGGLYEAYRTQRPTSTARMRSCGAAPSGISSARSCASAIPGPSPSTSPTSTTSPMGSRQASGNRCARRSDRNSSRASSGIHGSPSTTWPCACRA